MDWVDLLIIGLLLLAAVHGLRLGALIQILTFGGFWLGLWLGALVWTNLLKTPHDSTTRAILIIALVLGTACGLGYLGRVIGTYSNISLRRHHLGNVDAALGVGVAVVAVLLSVWLVAAVISSPNSRFASLDAAVNRSDILHSIDRILPQTPSIFNDLQNFLNNQGFPQVFSTLTPPSTPNVAPPTSAQTRALSDPAVFSTVKILGTACTNEQEGSGFVVGPGLVATNAHVVAGEGSGNTQVLVGGTAYGATPVYFDPSFDLAVLRTSAPLGPVLTISSSLVPNGTQAALLGYPEDGPLRANPATVSEEVTAIGKDIYNSGSVTRGVYALDAIVQPGNSGGPLMGPGGQVIGVVFSRSTVYSNVGYALTSPGVLSRVQAAEQHHAAVSTGSCISG
ncbi:MAG TPA: MarP family serine protease [Acidimicrobiales bacterium]|nr:MarP family serine protease [Acidimicrobiales bacterium]